MTREEILTVFRETGVMLEGHFQLTSGRHSDKYMQCARLFQYPDIAEKFAKELAGKFNGIDMVAGPASAASSSPMRYRVSLKSRTFSRNAKTAR
jgi:orotate phosphoribosyltransferase